MITAVYSGDGNFAGSQSQGQQNATVVGDTLSIADLGVEEGTKGSGVFDIDRSGEN